MAREYATVTQDTLYQGKPYTGTPRKMQEGQAKEHFAERFGGGNLIKRMGKKTGKRWKGLHRLEEGVAGISK